MQAEGYPAPKQPEGELDAARKKNEIKKCATFKSGPVFGNLYNVSSAVFYSQMKYFPP